MKRKWYGLFCLICPLFLLISCTPASSENREPMNKNFLAMNTYNTFTVYDDVSADVLDSAER